MISKESFCSLMDITRMWIHKADVLCNEFNIIDPNNDFTQLSMALVKVAIAEMEDVPDDISGWESLIVTFMDKFKWGTEYKDKEFLAVVNKVKYKPTTVEELYDVLLKVYERE